MRCPWCFHKMEKEVYHYEHETVVVYRCPVCGHVEKHHYIRHYSKIKPSGLIEEAPP